MESRVKIGEVNATLENSIAGMKVTKSFCNEEEELNKFNKSNNILLTLKILKMFHLTFRCYFKFFKTLYKLRSSLFIKANDKNNIVSKYNFKEIKKRLIRKKYFYVFIHTKFKFSLLCSKLNNLDTTSYKIDLLV